MPPLPQVSSDQLIRALGRLGFEQRAGKGSHTVMRRGGTVCVVPHRNPIPRGTLASVLKQAGVSPEELQSVL